MTQIIYIAILSLGLGLGYVAEKEDRKAYVYFLILLLTFLAGFRGENCGVDTPSYYNNVIKGFPYPWMFREEGFRAMATFFMNRFKNPQLVFVSCAFITNYLILKRLWDFRKEANYSFMVLIYVLLYYSNSMNIMRQYVAVAFIFYGTRYLKKNKLFFIPFLMLAFSFHRSSLLAIGYFGIVLWKDFSKKKKAIFSLPMLLMVIGSIVYTNKYLAKDISSYSAQVVDNVNVTYFYLLIITLLVLITYKLRIGIKITEHITHSYKYKKRRLLKTGIRITEHITPNKDATGQLESDVSVYVLIGLAFKALSMFFEFVGRTGLYYSIFDVVFWGIACKNLKNSKLNRVLILIYAIYIFMLIIVKNDIKLFPYEVFFY